MKKVYLAIPYSGMCESSYEQANKFTVEALKMGYNPFSPITHSHPLSKYEIPGDWGFWSKIDYSWIDVCEEVWVLVPKEGIDKIHKSIGVKAELKYAKQNNKPIKVFHFTKQGLRKYLNDL